MRAIFKRYSGLCMVVAIYASTISAACAQSMNMETDPVELAKAALGDQRGIAIVGVWRDGRASYGEAKNDGAATSTPDVEPAQPLFEIGSISKVFTGVLLAQAVDRGDLSLDDNLGKLLKDKANLDPSVAAITLRQLITHSSCLPRMPANFKGDASEDNPYANYDRPRMWAALSALKLDNPPPCDAVYSNFGVAIVGQLLSERYGKPWDVLVRERITAPLGMRDTVQILGDKAPRLAPAFRLGKPASPWDMQAFAGAGGLRSTAADMLVFGRALLAGKSGPLGAAAERVVTPLGRFDSNQIGYAMIIVGPEDKRTWDHSGGTGGYRTELLIAPDLHEVVVVLVSNAEAHINEATSALMASRYPIKDGEATVDAGKLPEYAGVYRIDQKLSFTFVAQGGKLFGRLTGQFFNPLKPTEIDTFSFPQVDAQFKFARDGGKVVSVTLTQRGGVLHAARTDAPVVGMTPERDLQDYAGHYRNGPDFQFDVYSLNGQLAVKLNNQPRFPVIPIAGKPDWFAWDVVEAKAQFERDAAGKVVALTLHQNGDKRAERLTPAEEIERFAAEPLYIRGSMNQWGLANPLKATGKSTYMADVALGAGHHTFKIGSQDFDSVSLGASADRKQVVLGEPKTLTSTGVGQDLAVDIKEPGRYTFTFDVSAPNAPVLTVTRMTDHQAAKLD